MSSQRDGSFARAHVTLGYRAGDRYEITDGLRAGEQIVVDGGLFRPVHAKPMSDHPSPNVSRRRVPLRS